MYVHKDHKAVVCAKLPLLPKAEKPIKAHGFQRRCRRYTTYICIIKVFHATDLKKNPDKSLRPFHEEMI